VKKKYRIDWDSNPGEHIAPSLDHQAPP